MENFFFGKNGLTPWIGIVERRNSDDLKIGRCKIRAFGYHSADTSLQPTDLLPDAYPLEALSGTFWSTPKEGETVFGYFLDEKKQMMIILGRLPAAFQREVNHPEGTGFKDARTQDELASYPRQTIGKYSYSADDGVIAQELVAASKYPPFGTDKASIPFLSRAIESEIPDQIAPAKRKSYAAATTYKTATGGQWSELASKWAAKYPLNHAYESESLHSMEFDDTPGSERVSLHHRLGSGIEYFPDGSTVDKCVKDRNDITLGNKKIGISGSCDEHIKGDYTLLVDGNMTLHVSGDLKIVVEGEKQELIVGNETRNVGSDSKVSVDGDFINKASGTLWLKGSQLQENSSSTPDVPEVKS